MFKELIDTAEELEATLRLLREAEDEEDEDPPPPQTIQAVAGTIFRALHALPETEEGARPGTGFALKLYVDPRSELYPMSRWDLDMAISLCAVAPRGGLLVVGIPGQPVGRVRDLVGARILRRIGERRVLKSNLRETAREGSVLALLLRHVPGHRAPDKVDGEPGPGRIDSLVNDEEVERYVYRGSPASLSAKDTLWQYGLATFDEEHRRYLPTLAGLIAFAGRPGLQGLAFHLVTAGGRQPIAGLALRELCDRTIAGVLRVDPDIDPETVRQMLLHAVVHRSWRPGDQRWPIGVEVGPRAITVRFPGGHHPGWTRNELLLQLVRRNRSLGWDASTGAPGAFRATGEGDETVLVLERRPAPVQLRQATPSTSPSTPPPVRPQVRPQVRPETTTTAPSAAASPSAATSGGLPMVTTDGPDMRAFIENALVVDKDALVDNPVLWGAFTTWCRRHGATEVPSQRWLALRLKAYGFQQAPGRTEGVRRWQGLRLLDEHPGRDT